jgi:hypothetical protein
MNQKVNSPVSWNHRSNVLKIMCSFSINMCTNLLHLLDIFQCYKNVMYEIDYHKRISLTGHLV